MADDNIITEQDDALAIETPKQKLLLAEYTEQITELENL